MSAASTSTACAVAVACLAWAAAPAAQRGTTVKVPEAAERSIERTLAAYAEGDDAAIERWLNDRTTRGHVLYLGQVLERPAPWSRARAAFALEVAWQRDPELLPIGRAMIAARPAAFGVDPTDDRFELLWHQAAIGVLSRYSRVELLLDYLQFVGPRLDEARRRGVATESRLALTRGFASAIVCCWKRVAGEVVRYIPASARPGVTLDSALAQFEQAAADPALRVEALIRGGRLLFDAGRTVDAVAWLDRVPAHDDPGLGYVHHITYAHALDTSNRSADAAAAYRRALTFMPQAQHASIGLAAALLRAGHPEEAARAADEARRMTLDAAAALTTFRKGDARLVPAWLADIRKLRR